MAKAIRTWEIHASQDVKTVVGTALRLGSRERQLRTQFQVDIEMSLNHFLEAEVRRLGRTAHGDPDFWRVPSGYINHCRKVSNQQQRSEK